MTEQERPFGVNVIGYLQSVLGLGELARHTVAALDAASVATLPVSLATNSTFDRQPFARVPPSHAAFPVNLICGSSAIASQLATEYPSLLQGRYSIGWWWWEVGRFPEALIGSLELVDEVWAGSSFVAGVLEPLAPVPVVRATVPIDLPAGIREDRAGFGFGPDEFVFLFIFDYNSTFQRKNPLGLIEAFTAAFAPSSGARLVLKCINEHHHPAAHERVCAASGRHPHVRVLEGYFPPVRKNALIASCDCYVSLHRSEGFGITLAEAMWLAKPVIATAYSGNMDFTSAENSYLVDYTLVPIGPGAEPYPVEGMWAEPDQADAIAQMQRVFERREEAAARGVRAAREIRGSNGIGAAAEMIRTRLEQVLQQLVNRTGAAGVAAAPHAATVRGLINSGPRQPVRSALGPAGPAARRVALRLMKPFTAHEREVDELMLGEIDELADRLAVFEAETLRNARSASAGVASVAQHAELSGRALSDRLHALESEVAALRTLVERLPDWIENWPRALAELRASDDYARAYSGDPLISIRIATYDNTDELIELALASVLRQTYPHWEVRIVGDNCSADVVQRIAAIEDPRISFRNRGVRGPYPEERYERWLVTGTYPYNEALAETKGDWIAPLDDDDEWTDDHLEVLLRDAQATGAELVYGIMRVVIDGSDTETWFGKWPPQRSEFGFQSSLYHAGLRHFRYDTHAHLKGEPADFDLARRMLEAGVQFRFIEQVVGTYHVGANDHHVEWWRERASERRPWQPPLAR